jgi:hypothetical protein
MHGRDFGARLVMPFANGERTSMRKRLTYANVVSTVCLFVVLGGTATAASKLLTGKQIKNESITGVDVKNGSLLSRDFKAGQLPSGPQGPAGAQGPAGPSDAYNNGLFPGGSGVSLAPGGYDVRALIQGDNTKGASAVELTCTLTVGSPSDLPPGPAKAIYSTTLPAGGKSTLPLEQIHTLQGQGSANVECSGPWAHGTVFATRVGTVHEI